jgi:DNA-binding CsgD family transcriptional regulator
VAEYLFSFQIVKKACMGKGYDYKMFMHFIEIYRPLGFLNIKRTDSFIVEMEVLLHHHKQIFHISDQLRFKILFASGDNQNYLGLNPDMVDPGSIIPLVHLNDTNRLIMSRTKLIKMGHDLFTQKKGISIISTDFRLKNVSGSYKNVLFQAYLFYDEVLYRTVYQLMVLTDISEFGTIKNNHHFYTGNDPEFFRYPDKKLLQTGSNFTNQELKILKLIAVGLDSEGIAKKLSPGVQTVNSALKHILNKTGKSSTIDLIIELTERGIL